MNYEPISGAENERSQSEPQKGSRQTDTASVPPAFPSEQLSEVIDEEAEFTQPDFTDIRIETIDPLDNLAIMNNTANGAVIGCSCPSHTG
jgi:hypothetical protein